MVKFGGKIGTLYQMLKNAFKKHPLQNRTNVQIKGGGQRPFEQCSKKLHFSERRASLNVLALEPKKSLEKINPAKYDLNCKQNVLLQIFSYIFMTSWRSPYSTTLPYPITEIRPPRLIRQIFSRSKICRKGEYFHFAGQTVTS